MTGQQQNSLPDATLHRFVFSQPAESGLALVIIKPINIHKFLKIHTQWSIVVPRKNSIHKPVPVFFRRGKGQAEIASPVRKNYTN